MIAALAVALAVLVPVALIVGYLIGRITNQGFLDAAVAVQAACNATMDERGTVKECLADYRADINAYLARTDTLIQRQGALLEALDKNLASTIESVAREERFGRARGVAPVQHGEADEAPFRTSARVDPLSQR